MTPPERTTRDAAHNGVRITMIAGEGDACEFRLGRHVAYGTWESPEVYSVDHGPTQADVDAISAALDATTDAAKALTK